MVILLAAATAAATPAAAQTFEQFENRQTLERSNRAVSEQAQRRDRSTTATVNNRVERLQLRQQMQADRQMSLPGLGARPPLR